MKMLTSAALAPSRLAVIDVIAHVVLAFGIGLATAIALAGVVLLLAQGGEAADAAAAPQVQVVAKQVQGAAAWRSAP